MAARILKSCDLCNPGPRFLFRQVSVTSSYSQNRINKSTNRVLKCSTVCKTAVKTKSLYIFLVYFNFVHLGLSKNWTNLFHTFSNSIHFTINSGQMQNKHHHQPMWNSGDGMFIIMCNVSFPINVNEISWYYLISMFFFLASFVCLGKDTEQFFKCSK